MKIIGSGFGRTGTLSLKQALEQLGFAPCYHMTEVIKRPKHIAAWCDVAAGRSVDWVQLFDEFEATVDFPASVKYESILAAFPDAKVIHTVRDPERWYHSTRETIYTAATVFPGWARRWIRPVRQFTELSDGLLWNGLFQGRFEEQPHAIEIFERWTDEVRRAVPADKLLVYQLGEGWEPLCAFLGVPVPDTPFPHVNDRQEMIRSFRRVRMLLRWGPIVLLSAMVAALLWLSIGH